MKKISIISFLFVILFLSISFNVVDGNKQDDLHLYMPADLEATLWAESPMFYNPTNIDTDSKGRIWVTEAVNYRFHSNDSTLALHHPKGDRVIILEDTNQDGKADKSTVFVDDPDLISPLGIAVVGNKVIVSCSPNLIVYTDDNGDDKPDRKEVLLTGFGGLDHDHALHSMVVGPDGRWYFSVGNAGPHTVTDKSGWTLRSGSLYTGGTPYNLTNEGNRISDDGKIWVGGIEMVMNPDGTGLKVLGHGFRNSYETYMDSFGDMWQNDNDDQVVTCRVSSLLEGGNAGYFSPDGTRFWQSDQRPGQRMFTAHWHQEDPGVMPAGDNSGAGAPTGITVNEGDGLGLKYRGMLFSADAGRNVIFGYQPELKGAGFKLAGKRTNFVSSLPIDNKAYVWHDEKSNSDFKKWFRPSDVMMGTDGAMYIADWYDPVVGGHQMVDTKGYGRIYRITPKNKKLVSPIINLNTSNGLLEALMSPAINVRAMGFEGLKSQGDKALEIVKSLLVSKNPYHQARAIWLMAQLGPKGQYEVEQLVSSRDTRISVSAFRALRSVYSTEKLIDFITNSIFNGLPKQEVNHSTQKDNFSSAFLHREIAIALRDIPLELKKDILLKIMASYDGLDNSLLESIGNSIGNDADKLFSNIQQLFEKQIAASPAKWHLPYARLIWRLHPVSAVPVLASWANSQMLSKEERSKAMTGLAFINHKSAVTEMIKLSKSNSQDVVEGAKYWLSFRQTNDWIDLLDWKSLEMNLGVEKKRAEMKAASERILNEYISLDTRSDAAKSMASDSIGGQMIIGMMLSKLFPKDLYASVDSLLIHNPDKSVRVQAINFLNQHLGNSYSMTVIDGVKADSKKGKNLFIQNCSSCHRIGVNGKDIGPDLTLISKKYDKSSLLNAIINPNASIVFGYEPWVIETKERETFYGFLLADSKAIIIKDVAGVNHTIRKENIMKREKQSKTLMPSASSMGLSNIDLANLIGYLTALD